MDFTTIKHIRLTALKTRLTWMSQHQKCTIYIQLTASLSLLLSAHSIIVTIIVSSRHHCHYYCQLTASLSLLLSAHSNIVTITVSSQHHCLSAHSNIVTITVSSRHHCHFTASLSLLLSLQFPLIIFLHLSTPSVKLLSAHPLSMISWNYLFVCLPQLPK